MTTTQTDMLDTLLPGYVFWYAPHVPHPYRWAVAQVPNGYEKRHGSHHGGASTQALALVAAETHASVVAADGFLHPA
ncbi:MAG: hypothetical protein COA94_05995 [Rickettsiales bacterium]|nr:MAG: hypothetical protein COA94_05995 [Rickettsiales bacterium]